MKRTLLRSAHFLRAAKRLVKTRREIAPLLQPTLEALANDAFQPSLRSHKLKGELKDHWSCSLGREWRIVFEFVQHEGGHAILLHSMGTHDEVY